MSMFLPNRRAVQRQLAACAQLPLRSTFCAGSAHCTISPHLRRDDNGYADDKRLPHFFDKPDLIASEKVATHSANATVLPPKMAVAQFRRDVHSKIDARIIAGYATLLHAFELYKSSFASTSSRPFKLGNSFPLRKWDIQTAMRFLMENAKAKRYMDRKSLEASLQMHRDMVDKFGFEHGPHDLHSYLQTVSLQQHRSCDGYDPMQVLQDLVAEYPDWRPSSIEYNMVARFLGKTRQYDRARQLVEEMKHKGVTPDTGLLVIMFNLHLQNDNFELAESDLHLIQEQDINRGIKALTTAVETYCDLYQTRQNQRQFFEPRLRKYAQQLESSLHTSSTSSDSPGWSALLRYNFLILGPAHALQIARQSSRTTGFTGEMVVQMLRLQIDDLHSLQTSDQALSVLNDILDADPTGKAKPSDEAYAVLVLALLGQETRPKRSWEDRNAATIVQNQPTERDANPTPNQIREAQMLYDHLRAKGTPPGPRMLAPLLTAYCEAFLPSLSAAMRLIRDLLQSKQTTLTSSSTETTPALSMNIINPVINACVKLQDLTAANDLITRMRKAGVTMQANDKLHIVCRLMPIATTWREAFAIYQNVSRLPLTDHSRQGYDENGYTTLLDVFRKLSCTDDEFGDAAHQGAEHPAPPEYMLCIVEDMRRSGYQPSCIFYTTILDYYSKLSTPSYDGVQATHDLLKSDENLEPDLPLINALMNAYNRASEPSVVLAIWDSLTATRQEIDGITLSVLFDTCGRYGLLQRARMALTSTRRIEADKRGSESGSFRFSAMNKGAWDSYLECLARCDRIEEAIQLLFGEMRKSLLREAIDANILADADKTVSFDELLHRQTREPLRTRTGQIVGPDFKTVGTLLRFAARERDRSDPPPLGSFFPISRFSFSAVNTSNPNHSIWHTLRQRIKKDYSWLYPSVEHIGDPSSPSP